VGLIKSGFCKFFVGKIGLKLRNSRGVVLPLELGAVVLPLDLAAEDIEIPQNGLQLEHSSSGEWEKLPESLSG